MTNNTNVIVGGISLEKWRNAFIKVLERTINSDDFSDILFFELYPNIEEEIQEIEAQAEDECAAEEAVDEIYASKYDYAYKAFKLIFGITSIERE